MDNIEKYKKIIIIAIGVILLLLIVVIAALIMRKGSSDTTTTGSTGTTQQTSDVPAGSSGEKVELIYSGLWEPPEVMEPLIKKYEASHPNVTIKYTQQSFAQYEDKMYQRVVDNAPLTPDIIRFHNTWLPKYEAILSPVPSNIYTREQFIEDFYPTHVHDLTGSDGNLYGIPLEIDGLILFYNVDLFDNAGIDKPGTDWDTIRTQATELTETNESGDIVTAGLGIGAASNIRHSAEILSLLMLQNGMNADDFYDPTTRTIILNDSGGKNADALATYVSFLDDQVWSPDIRSDLEFFYSGRLAMFIGPSWEAVDIVNANPALNFKTVPTPVVGTTQMYLADYWAEGVTKTSKHPQEAWEFVKWLSQEQQQKEFYSNASGIRVFGEPYSRRSLASELSDLPYVGAVMQEAPYMTAYPGINMYVVTDALDDAIRDVLAGDEPDQALQKAEDTINEYLREY